MSREADCPYEGFNLYVVLHKKEGRRMACLVPIGEGKRTTISYARYLISVSLGRKLNKEETVDHINNDKLDDRLENLQILSWGDNIRKSARPKRYKDYVCPICSIEFKLELRCTHKKTPPCCSRRCGHIKANITRQSQKQT